MCGRDKPLEGRLGGSLAILDILVAPHPVLAKKARLVRDDEFGEALARHTSDMAETMYAAPGVGLAAPQVGDPRRIVVIDPTEGDDRGRELVAMVNPEIVERSEDTIPWWETCLSVPDMEVKVQRARKITVRWRDPLGEAHEEVFEDFPSVVVQHELDHLVGTVLLDRVSRFRKARYLKMRKKKRK